MKSARGAVITATLVLGASGIASQTLLLREFLILFSGNEFSLGIIIGSWVLAGALGALAGGRFSCMVSRPAATFIFLTLLCSIIFPLTIVAIRLYKQLAGLSPDLGVGIGQIFLSSTILLLPVGFLHGMLFVLACALIRDFHSTEGSAGRAYFLSTAGTIAGGILTAFFLVPRINALSSASLVLLVNSVVCIWLARTLAPQTGRIALPTAAGVAVMAMILVSGGADRLQTISVGMQWQGKELLSYRNSPYQNIAVVRTENQFTVFTDGIPLVALPDPDIAAVEEFAHIPLLAHPHPVRVLLLGGGAGGVISEILRHPSVQSVDYVELDPLLLATIAEYAAKAGRSELGDPRVRLHFRDGRLFIRESRTPYDLVLIHMPLPQTLATNRFFSREFFQQVRQTLAPDGVLAVAATGSLTYYGEELKQVNTSLQATLRDVFPGNAVVPGDLNLYLASPGQGIAGIDASLLSGRLIDRHVTASLISAEHLEQLLSIEQRRWYDKAMQGSPGEINRDFSPRMLFHFLEYLNIQFTPGLKPAFSMLKGLSFQIMAALLAGLTLSVLCSARRWKRGAILYAIATTGFSGMVLELLLLLAFQVLHGAMFQAVGLLLTTFMAGLAAGCLLMTTGGGPAAHDRRMIVVVETGLVCFALVLSFCFSRDTLMQSITPSQAYAVVLPLLLVAGFLTGAEFPLAASILGGGGVDTERAGFVYGADLMGGWLGGIIGGAVLLPFFGAAPTCLLLGGLKMGSLLVLRSSFSADNKAVL